METGIKSLENNSVISPNIKNIYGTVHRGHKLIKLIYVVSSQESGYLGARRAGTIHF